MDSLIALKGKDFVIIAADTTNAYSVLRMKVTSITPRTSMIKYGISMVRSCLQLEANTLTCSCLETISKKILLSCSIKMDTNFPLMTLPSTSGHSWQKPSEKAPIQSTVFWLDSKETNQDCIGLIILGQ